MYDSSLHAYVLSLECEGELIRQSVPQPKKACIEEFISYYCRSANKRTN